MAYWKWKEEKFKKKVVGTFLFYFIYLYLFILFFLFIYLFIHLFYLFHFYFYFLFFCFSLFKTTEICLGSSKMEIFYRENAFHAGKKIRKNDFAPSEKYAFYDHTLLLALTLILPSTKATAKRVESSLYLQQNHLTRAFSENRGKQTDMSYSYASLGQNSIWPCSWTVVHFAPWWNLLVLIIFPMFPYCP